ncbi:hypothetical protein DFH11DRAFT_382522 [Phellopilus nigrolimitatus]|nr:hypothetical protein DFH11DRAFT_382522 [Phellopilus nigrolimitatus]
MLSTLLAPFDAEPPSLKSQAIVKQEPTCLLDLLSPFSETNPLDLSALCPELDRSCSDASTDSSCANASPLLSPPSTEADIAHSEIGMAYSTAPVKKECEDAYIAPGPLSLFSDFLGGPEDVDQDASVIGIRDTFVKYSVPPILGIFPSKGIANCPPSELQQVTNAPRKRRGKVFSRAMPFVAPCQPLDAEVWVECSDTNDGSPDAFGRVVRVRGWTPPEDDKYPLADVFGDWAQIASAFLEGEKSNGPEKVVVNQSAAEKSNTKAVAKSSKPIKPTAGAPSNSPAGKKIKWARRSQASHAESRKKRRTTPALTLAPRYAAPPVSVGIDVQSLLVPPHAREQLLPRPSSPASLLPRQVPVFPGSGHVSSGPGSARLDSDTTAPASSLKPFRRSPRRLSACSSQASSVSGPRIEPIAMGRKHKLALDPPSQFQFQLPLYPRSEQAQVQQQREYKKQQYDSSLPCAQPPGKGKARLTSLLPPALAKSITQHAHAARAEESVRVRRLLEEDMRQLERDEEEEKGRQLVNEYLDLGLGSGEGEAERGASAARSDTTKLLPLPTPSSGRALPGLRSFLDLDYPFSPRRRALGRYSTYPVPSIARPGECASVQHNITASFAGSLSRTLSESASLAPVHPSPAPFLPGISPKRRSTDSVDSDVPACAKKMRLT